MTSHSNHLFEAAWSRVAASHRPSTSAAHCLHFRTFLSFLIFLHLPLVISVHNLLIFLEYLYNNSLSPKVIKNYLASISTWLLITSWTQLPPNTKPSVNTSGVSPLTHPFPPLPEGYLPFKCYTKFLWHATFFLIPFCIGPFSNCLLCFSAHVKYCPS